MNSIILGYSPVVHQFSVGVHPTISREYCRILVLYLHDLLVLQSWCTFVICWILLHYGLSLSGLTILLTSGVGNKHMLLDVTQLSQVYSQVMYPYHCKVNFSGCGTHQCIQCA